MSNTGVHGRLCRSDNVRYDSVINDTKVAIVTGGSSGFGRLMSITLARNGYRVFAAFRGSKGGFEGQAKLLEARAAAASADLETVEMDVTDDGSVNGVVRDVIGRAGRIDVLVNNAGVGMLGPIENTTVEQAQALFDVNVFGVLRTVRAVVPVMRKQRSGTIINVGSDQGVHANLFHTMYAPSKAAVESLSQVLRWELQQFGIRVVVLAPGWYKTEFGESLVKTFEGPAGQAYARLAEALTQGRAAVESGNDEPQQVADRVLEILQRSDAPFRVTSGWNPVRMAGVNPTEIDEYERRLFEHYQLGEFAGPWVKGPEATK
jgi:NAD(P)-dependent dehydrogenase (short-subunit alcohol dehydrogenase family)